MSFIRVTLKALFFFLLCALFSFCFFSDEATVESQDSSKEDMSRPGTSGELEQAAQ